MSPSFIVRDAEPKDRPRWEPLWQDYQSARSSTAQIGSVCYLQDMFTVETARGRGVVGP